MRHTAVPASYIILRKGDEVLLIRRANTGYHDGWYALPAGHVEAGELPFNTIIREAKEEIGVDLEKKDVQFSSTLYRTKHDETGDRADYFFTAAVWMGEPINCEPHKCDDLGWFPIAALPKNTTPVSRLAIMNMMNGVRYAELTAEDLLKHKEEFSAYRPAAI